LEKVLRYSIPLLLLYAFLFFINKDFDIYFSCIFFDGTFVQKGDNLATFIYDSVDYLSIFLILFLSVSFFYEVLKKRSLVVGLDKKGILFILTFLVFANGVVINKTLKEFSGRARPSKIVEFGGTQNYTPPVLKAYECNNHNCSFSSGHSGMAFSLMVFALFFPLYKNLIFFVALAYGALVSVARVAQGGHFLSDTIFSFFVVIFSMQLLFYLFYREKAPTYYAKNGLFFVIFFIILTFYYLHGYFLEKL